MRINFSLPLFFLIAIFNIIFLKKYIEYTCLLLKQTAVNVVF